MTEHSPAACLIIIGNEILSGRTQDKNMAFIAQELNSVGVRLSHARVIPDVEAIIVENVNQCRAAYDYVFTTGGIGPTHDDITSASIAKALGRACVRHPEAEKILRAHYGERVNDMRLRMAEMPEGASLIPNPISAAPGFYIENVYVLAGVPGIMQAMIAHAKHMLRPGKPVLSKTFTLLLPEGELAKRLGEIQSQHPQVEIGSYPFIRDAKLGTSLVLRCADEGKLAQAAQDLSAYLSTFPIPFSTE